VQETSQKKIFAKKETSQKKIYILRFYVGFFKRFNGDFLRDFVFFPKI